MKLKKLLTKIAVFLLTTFMLFGITVSKPVIANDTLRHYNFNEISSITTVTKNNDIIGKTFQYKDSTQNTIVKFYSYEYNETQDTCMEINDKGRITYIYFNHILYDKESGILSALSYSVRGYWKEYAPLQIICKWKEDKLDINVSLPNGMSIIYNEFSEVKSPDIEPDDKPSSKNEFIFNNEINYGIIDGSTFIYGTYFAKNPDNINNELLSIEWNLSDPSIASIKNFTYICAPDNKSASWILEITNINHGTTLVSANLSSIGLESKHTTLEIEPKLVLPEKNSNIVDKYDSTIILNQLKKSFKIEVQISKEDKPYLSNFIEKTTLSIKATPNENTAIAKFDYNYAIVDDGKSATIDIVIDDKGILILDNLLILETPAQKKTIRIINDTDIDEDGLLDTWELEGIDYNDDGIVDVDLKAMGAVVGHKDIFVEVDAMEGFFPNQTALDIVAKQFINHEFYLHIDAGPESVDYITGKKWGNLSRSNTIPYEENINLGEYYENWQEMTNINFSEERRPIFRHCIFLNQFNNTAHTGIAADAPSQYFICAQMKDLDDTKVAGTFMHELGHTLGLLHGGNENVNFKPNYLSIMNYSYQLSGLYGTNEVNYSEYILPALDESNLNEYNGVDPEGKTAGSNLGIKWYSNNENLYASNIAKSSIDFNKDHRIVNSLNMDINRDGSKKTKMMASINDWANLKLQAGSIGDLGAASPGASISIPKESVVVEDMGLDEFIENGLFDNPHVVDDSYSSSPIVNTSQNQNTTYNYLLMLLSILILYLIYNKTKFTSYNE